MGTRTRRTLMLALALALSAGVGAGAGIAHEQGRVPVCEEDALVIGTGEFEDGRWSDYICGPTADDYGWQVIGEPATSEPQP